MSLTHIIKKECPSCGKLAVEVSRINLFKTKLIKLQCGCLVSEQNLIAEQTAYDSIIFSDNCKPRPYQIEAVKFAENSGIKCIIADEQGLGKGQILTDKILTPIGWKQFKDISSGDEIIGKDGKVYKITNIYDRGILPSYKVTFNDDTFVTVDGEHLWNVESHNDRVRGNNRYITVNTLRLHKLINKSFSGLSYYYIPSLQSPEFKEIPLSLITPYQMGVLLGDGSFRQDTINFTSEDEEIASQFSYARKTINNSQVINNKCYNYFLHNNYKVELKNLGLDKKSSHEKFIPDTYKFNSSNNRLELLRGLMDTDGSIWNNNVVEFTSTSKQLAEDVRFLIESFGGTCKLSYKVPKYYYKGKTRKGKTAYRLVINSPINPFKLKRKADLWKPRDKYIPQRSVKSIEFVGNQEIRCISVSSPDKLYVTNNCIITHNTIESLSIIRLHPKETIPIVAVVPTTVKLQWFYEIQRIINDSLGRKPLTQIINNSNDKAIPGFDFYIVTFDLLKKEEIFEFIPEIGLLIIDECQRIKNHESDRARAVQKISKKCRHIIAMSGTPIKNNAGEYFTVLNLVAPMRFPSYNRFLATYCDAYETFYGHRVGGLKDIDRFAEDTKDLIIRRTKAEVLKDLPSLDRKFYHVELGKDLRKAYSKAIEELEEAMMSEESAFEASSHILAIYSKMRHITGISKVPEVVDFSTEFLLSCERKLVIFVHHNDVAELIKIKLNAWMKDGGYNEVLHLHSGLNGDSRASLVEKFKESSNRILIASTLAAGEGLNLQFCSDAVILERQWNPANEEQAESRFHRFGQENPVSITYMLASGTIDEFFTELVEQKRSIVAATLDHKEIEWQQNSLMKELGEILVSKGRQPWVKPI